MTIYAAIGIVCAVWVSISGAYRSWQSLLPALVPWNGKRGSAGRPSRPRARRDAMHRPEAR
jgi:hypothetical protein